MMAHAPSAAWLSQPWRAPLPAISVNRLSAKIAAGDGSLVGQIKRHAWFDDRA
jgi:hypothetical protein